MKSWLAIIMCAALAPGAWAAPSAEGAPLKISRPGPAPTPARLAEAAGIGGDTFATALPITSTPFTGTGSTVGYANDYDEFCGTGLGSAPDVVYAFTPPATGYYRFDLCGSLYDTKLNLYDVNAVLLACNDDFDIEAQEGELCYMNARIADFPCTAGVTYYIVIDGYDSAAGDYTLTVSAWTHCDVVLPGDAVSEAEPALAIDQVDAHNCGCGCDGEPVFQAMTANPSGEVILALVQGWRQAGFRDFDTYRFTAGPSGTVHVEFTSEVQAAIRVLGNTDCEAPVDLEWARIGACGSAVLNAAVTPGADFLIKVEPVQYMSPWGTHPAAYEALLSVSGLSAGLPVEDTSWGRLKGMYR